MKQFFKFMFASTIGTVLGFIVILFVSGIIIAGIIGSAMMMASSSQKEVKVKSNSVLVIDLSDNIVERAPNNPFEQFDIEGFGGNEGTELEEMLSAIEYAAIDSNIEGILIRGQFFNGGMSTMESVRDYLEGFKESGKWIMAYEEMYTQGAYYVASVADEVYLFPEGGLDLRGLRSESAFFKGTMEKLGINATIIKGPDNIYKSAVEPFYREDMSEPNKVQIQRILDVVWKGMTDEIGTARGLSEAEINSIADELKVRNTAAAKDLNLVDDLVYYDEILSKLREKLGLESDDEIETIAIDKYARVDHKSDKNEKSWELKDEIAIIYAVGGISSGEGDEENIGSETLAKAIREAREDEDVKAIVMRVNSPGGSALASDVIWRESVLAREVKPFIVSFGDVAASGGYYISTHADRIFAKPTTITGSIGAFGIIPDMRGLLTDKWGITFDGVKTNRHADFGSMARGFDESEMALLNGYLEEIYTDFVTKVAEGRGTTYEMIDSLGRGRVWIGSDALENGLVDELGDLDDAIAYAAQMAELEDYDLIELPKKKDPFEKFMKGFQADMKYEVAEWFLGDDVKWMEKVDEIKQMQGIQTRMIYDIRVY